nr:MAG TPA: hypothetical protein [Caudoviricetes sp.]
MKSVIWLINQHTKQSQSRLFFFFVVLSLLLRVYYHYDNR